MTQIQAWQEEVERARQGQRDAEGKLSSLEVKALSSPKQCSYSQFSLVYSKENIFLSDGLLSMTV